MQLNLTIHIQEKGTLKKYDESSARSEMRLLRIKVRVNASVAV